LLVPLVIAAVCFGVGVFAAARWLPDLAPGTIGGLAFFAVVGLLAAALSLVGIQVWYLVHSLDHAAGTEKNVIVFGVLGATLWQTGLLVGLASITYLLAPRASARPSGPDAGPTTPPED
jgi:hypothetical protein